MADLNLDAIADEELARFGGFGENWKIRTIKAVRDRVRDQKPSVSLREIGQALDRAVLRKANPTRGMNGPDLAEMRTRADWVRTFGHASGAGALAALADGALALIEEVERSRRVNVEMLRELGGALNRMEANHPNPFYVGYGAAILTALGEPTDYMGGAS